MTTRETRGRRCRASMYPTGGGRGLDALRLLQSERPGEYGAPPFCTTAGPSRSLGASWLSGRAAAPVPIVEQ